MQRVLIVKPSSLGDIVHSLPVAAALAQSGAEVHFAARREYRDLLSICPAVRRILEFPGRLAGAAAFLGDLRRESYDAVVDLQGLLRSALATACARTPRRIGLPDAREGSVFFYDGVVSYPNGVRHAVDRYLSVLPLFGLRTDPPFKPDYGLVISTAAQEFAARHVGEPGYVVFSPLTRRPAKLWRLDAWARMAETLIRTGRRVVVVGHGKIEWPSPEPAWINLIGRTDLPQLCATISRARLCVTVDSAPMRLAAALAVPVVALFGPTDPAKVGPYTRDRLILRGEAPNLADLSCEGVAAVVLSELEKRSDRDG